MTGLERAFVRWNDAMLAAAKNALVTSLPKNNPFAAREVHDAKAAFDYLLSQAYSGVHADARLIDWIRESDRGEGVAWAEREIRDGACCSPVAAETARCSVCEDGLEWEPDDALGSMRSVCCGRVYTALPLGFAVAWERQVER